MFQLNQITVSPFVHIFGIISLFAIELEEPKIGICGKGFNIFTLHRLKSQKRLTTKVFVYKIQVNPIHTILKYGDYYGFMGR